MSMTLSRRNVYKRSWYRRECKFDIKRRRREYNRKIRHTKITEDSYVGDFKKLTYLEWNTLT